METKDKKNKQTATGDGKTSQQCGVEATPETSSTTDNKPTELTSAAWLDEFVNKMQMKF